MANDNKSANNAEKKEKKGGKGGCLIIILLLIAIILFLLEGLGFGIGDGFLKGKKSGESDNKSKTEATAAPTAAEEQKEETKDEDPTKDGVVEITVGQKLFVEGKEIKGTKMFEDYLNKINKDGVKYVLKDNNATEAEYAAAKEILDKLKLEYTEE